MSTALWLAVVTFTLAPPAPRASRPSAPARSSGRQEPATVRAEQLAADAVRRADADPQAALVQARQALALTNEFEPTAFVTAGRKGEVIEDEFQAAREGYSRHRAVLYEAVGSVLARTGAPLPASRYLKRAFLLEPNAGRGLALAQALNELGRGREALDVLRRATSGFTRLEGPAGAALERATDLAGYPSAQAEIDRGRLTAIGTAIELREGPLQLPPGIRLSNAPLFRLEDAPLSLIYAAEASCRSCSADLESLSRQMPADVRVLVLPAGDDQDAELRQVIALYRRPWPVLLGRDLATQLRLPPRSALLVARAGWSLAVVKAPFGQELAHALAALRRVDVRESVPRAEWNRRPPERSALAAQPALLPDGVAPGEDEPFPPEFTAAVAAYRGGRPAEAAKLFDALEAKGDGWLLPPEARLDKALCRAAAGQREAARRLLLRTGDSRFTEAIDRLLESVAGSR